MQIDLRPAVQRVVAGHRDAPPADLPALRSLILNETEGRLAGRRRAIAVEMAAWRLGIAA